MKFIVATEVFSQSKRNDLLQLADMIAGAVHRSFSRKDDRSEYRPIIRARELKVQVWPGENGY